MIFIEQLPDPQIVISQIHVSVGEYRKYQHISHIFLLTMSVSKWGGGAYLQENLDTMS